VQGYHLSNTLSGNIGIGVEELIDEFIFQNIGKGLVHDLLENDRI
jgi:hypothetical protein